jgi:hypothetical protein
MRERYFRVIVLSVALFCFVNLSPLVHLAQAQQTQQVQEAVRDGERDAKSDTNLVGLSLLVAQAQQTQQVQEAVRDGERDAESDTNPLLWMGAGFLLNVAGVGVAYFYEPSPPTFRLMGKSPDYVAVYTDAYKRKARDIQTRNALIGFGFSVAIYITFYYLYILAAFR